VGTGVKGRTSTHSAIRWKIGDTSPQDLNSLTTGRGKLVIIHATGISGNGYIAGENWDKSKSIQHACILIPEP
jgi:hypothetical protein